MFKYLTQNIDNLEESAGFALDDIIQAHGANFGATCAKCKKASDREELHKGVSEGTVVRCKRGDCNGPIKPDIVFFGEQLPETFTDFM